MTTTAQHKPLLHDATVTCSSMNLPLRIPTVYAIHLDYDDAMTVPLCITHDDIYTRIYKQFLQIATTTLPSPRNKADTQIPKCPCHTKKESIAFLCCLLAIDGLLLFAGSSFATINIFRMLPLFAAVPLVTQGGAVGLLSLIVSLSFIELPQRIPNYRHVFYIILSCRYRTVISKISIPYLTLTSLYPMDGDSNI